MRVVRVASGRLRIRLSSCLKVLGACRLRFVGRFLRWEVGGRIENCIKLWERVVDIESLVVYGNVLHYGETHGMGASDAELPLRTLNLALTSGSLSQHVKMNAIIRL